MTTPQNNDEMLCRQDAADFEAAIKALRELGGWGLICIEVQEDHVKEVKVTFSKRRKKAEPRAP